MTNTQKSNLDSTINLIPSYKFITRAIEHDGKQSKKEFIESWKSRGGFNHYSSKLSQIHNIENNWLTHEILDHITAAVEAGVIDKNNWPSQLFATENDLEAFFAELEQYDECYRITDRWWTALASLADSFDEEGFILCSDIVAILRESIIDGKRRMAVKVAQSETFAIKLPKPIKLSNKNWHLLWRYNSQLTQKARVKSLIEDLSCEFEFPQPIFFIKEKTIFARQATQADIRGIVEAENVESTEQQTKVKTQEIKSTTTVKKSPKA